MSTGLVDIGLDFGPSASAGTETVDVAGEAILVARGGTHLHLLNSAATLVWSFLDGRATVGAIVDDLAAGIGLPHAMVKAEVVGLLRGLWAAGMLAGSEDDAEPELADVVDPRFIREPPSG